MFDKRERLPNLLIIGVHKSATTSLYTYLNAHPEILGATKKEVHFFTPLIYKRALAPLPEYIKYFSPKGNERFLLDASPTYFYGKELVIEKMQEVLPAHNVILILREPTARFISFFKSMHARFIIDEDISLADFFEKSKTDYERQKIEDAPFSRAFKEGVYIDFLPSWVEQYKDNLILIDFEELTSDPKKVLLKLAKQLGVEHDFYHTYHFTREGKTVLLKNKNLHKFALKVNETFEGFFRRHPVLKHSIRSVYQAILPKSSGPIIDKKSVSLLQAAYLPYNKKLAQYLNSKQIPSPEWLKY